MSLAKFFDTLNPFSKKRDVSEKIRLINESIDITTAMLVDVIDGEVTLKNLPKLEDALKHQIKSGTSNRVIPKDNLAITLQEILRNCKDILVTMESIFNNESGDVSVDGITYHRITMLNVIATVSFMATFIHRYVTVQSLARVQAEVDWVNQNLRKFALAAYVLHGGAKNIQKVLSELPDRIYTPEGDLVAGVATDQREIDPLQFNLIGLEWNPFYAIGVKWAQHNMNRIAAYKADQKALTFKISMLKDRRSGVEDAALERQIRVYEEAASDAATSIAKLERRYGITA